VAFNGSTYLVVWQDNRNTGWNIYGARVSTVGKVLNPKGFAVSADKGQQKYPRLAAGKSGYLVVWQDDRSTTSWDVYGTRVTP